MYTSHNTVKISDLRKHTDEVVKEIEKVDQPVVLFSHSEPRIVMVNLRWFQHMSGRTEDQKTPHKKEKHGIDFFIDPPEEFLIKAPGLDAVKLIRAERD